MRVSIIIPARNAASTIAHALFSIQLQTYSNWDAVVVDDGSDDETQEIVRAVGCEESRIRLLSQPMSGVSAARNLGVASTRSEYLLFLDADDWLRPTHLARLTEALSAEPRLGGVHCGWVRAPANGAMWAEEYAPDALDLFPSFARHCAFVIHACLIRRTAVENVGSFDTELDVCEDWDLWQRIARTGVRFRHVHEALAVYRLTPGSASMDYLRLLDNGLKVIERGHTVDPRVPKPSEHHRHGPAGGDVVSARVMLAVYCAGLAIGSGLAAEPILDRVRLVQRPRLDASGVAHALFLSIPLARGRPTSEWASVWPECVRPIDLFLESLARDCDADDLAIRARTFLERLIVRHAAGQTLPHLDRAITIQNDISLPPRDINTGGDVEWLACRVLDGPRLLGCIELPVFDRFVPGAVLGDAIAAEYGWMILQSFLERTIYPSLRVRPDGEVWAVWRGTVCLARGITGDPPSIRSRFHDLIGWFVFLQELWGIPDWSPDEIYDHNRTPLGGAVSRAGELVDIEIGDPLTNLETPAGSLRVRVSLAGESLGIVDVPCEGAVATAAQVRVAITRAAGAELFIAAVRNCVLGWPLTDASPLRARINAKRSAAAWRLYDSSTLYIGRYFPGAIGSSVSRHAALPWRLADEYVKSARTRGASVVVPSAGGAAGLFRYRPDLTRDALNPQRVSSSCSSSRRVPDVRLHDSHEFDALFSQRPDPWRYTTPYEERKYQQTLEFVPRGTHRVLELACAEGHFTARLAGCVTHVVAADFARIALERAAVRCADLRNVTFLLLDIVTDPLPGPFDVIVCSEVLYYVGGVEGLRAVLTKCARALDKNGILVMAHANVLADDPDRPGFDWDVPFGGRTIGEIAAQCAELHLEDVIETPLYRIHKLRRAHRAVSSSSPAPNLRVFAEQPTAISSLLRTRIRWDGGQASSDSHTSVTTRLPILAYHHVSENRTNGSRFSITAAAFEEQLRYLTQAGFYGVSLDYWHSAVERHEPLPGRAILFTFDDGYSDFASCAWPLLSRYGFSAIVFLVADRVGGTNTWDADVAPASLLSWSDVRSLRDSGLQFGSHGCSHCRLASLSPVDVAAEAIRSRLTLEDRLGQHVEAIAYLYGEHDDAIRHIVGASGYRYGLTCHPARAGLWEKPLALPRIEIDGGDDLNTFVRKISTR